MRLVSQVMYTESMWLENIYWIFGIVVHTPSRCPYTINSMCLFISGKWVNNQQYSSLCAWNGDLAMQWFKVWHFKDTTYIIFWSFNIFFYITQILYVLTYSRFLKSLSVLLFRTDFLFFSVGCLCLSHLGGYEQYWHFL